MSQQLQFPEPVPSAINEAAGERAKQAGIARADKTVRHLDPAWVARCDTAIRTMARRGVVFQAADLIAEGLVEEPPHPNCWGARFHAAANAGVIRHHGYTESGRATVHKSICKTWIGTRRAA